MTPPTSIDPMPSGDPDFGALLDAYFAGDATPTQHEMVRRFAAESPDGERLLETLHDAWLRTGHVTVDALDAKRAAFMERLVATSHVHQPARRFRPRSHGASTWPRVWTGFAGLAAAAAIIIVATQQLMPGRDTPKGRAAEDRVLRTTRGQHASMALVDGTMIYAGAESQIRVREREDGVREVTLDGEAYFDVNPSARRAFVVRAGRVTTEVLGTAFVVRSYAADSSAAVLVTTGKVAVRAANNPTQRTVLTAGHQAYVGPRGPMLVRTEATGSPSLVVWLSGAMAFEQTPVRDVVTALERQYDVEIRVDDERLLQQRVSGVFADRSLSAKLSLLAGMLNARVERQGRIITMERQ